MAYFRRRAMVAPVIISTTVNNRAGMMPAANRSAIEIPPPAEARIEDQVV